MPRIWFALPALCLILSTDGPAAPRAIVEPTYHGRTLTQWVVMLRTGDAKARTRAALHLGLGPFNGPAVQPLASALDDDDPGVRLTAIHALARIGPDAAAAVPALARSMREPDEKVHRASCDALACIGGPAVHVLLEALPEDPMVAEAIERITSAGENEVQALLAAFGDPGLSKHRSALARALSNLGAPAVPGLMKALQHPVPAVRAEAAEALGRIGAKARDAVPALIECVEGLDGGVCASALTAIGDIGPEAKEAVPALEAALHSGTDTGEAARALAQLGEAGIVVLGEALEHEDPTVRSQATNVLEWFGSRGCDDSPVAALPAVKRALKDKDPHVRARLLRLAMQLSDAPTALSLVTQGLKDPDPSVRVAAVSTLGDPAIDDKTATSLLLQALGDPEQAVRAEAVSTLGSIEPLPDEAVPAVIKTLEDSSEMVRYHAAQTLQGAHLGARARPAISVLVMMLNGRRADQAARLLIEFGPEARTAIPELTRLLHDPGVKLFARRQTCLRPWDPRRTPHARRC
jgi:HEAT repeat protein